jgi:hypothetical protein
MIGINVNRVKLLQTFNDFLPLVFFFKHWKIHENHTRPVCKEFFFQILKLSIAYKYLWLWALTILVTFKKWEMSHELFLKLLVWVHGGLTLCERAGFLFLDSRLSWPEHGQSHLVITLILTKLFLLAQQPQSLHLGTVESQLVRWLGFKTLPKDKT